jgi:uncharacterized protein
MGVDLNAEHPLLVVGRWAMLINVAQLLKSDLGTIRHVDVDETISLPTDQIEFVGPVRGTAELIHTNRGVLVRAQLKSAARLVCSRCVEAFVDPLAIEFVEEYIPVLDVNTGAPTNIPHESYAYLINDRHELDLTEAVREYGLLALPMKPLCSTNCAGLCPQCGTNLNQTTCTCVAEVSDGRFAILKSLLAVDADNK